MLDEVIDVAAREGIDAGVVKGGTLTVARNPAQAARMAAAVAAEKSWQVDGIEILTKQDAAQRIRLEGVVAAYHNPHCARIQPALLVRGLADAAERLGVDVYERSPVVEIAAGRATLGDTAHGFFYAQRTVDDRIALGGRSVPYRFGSRTDRDGRVPERSIAQLRAILDALFPQLADVSTAHGWWGVLAVPRDWAATVDFDRATGLGWAGLAVTSATVSPPPTSRRALSPIWS